MIKLLTQCVAVELNKPMRNNSKYPDHRKLQQRKKKLQWKLAAERARKKTDIHNMLQNLI